MRSLVFQRALLLVLLGEAATSGPADRAEPLPLAADDECAGPGRGDSLCAVNLLLRGAQRSNGDANGGLEPARSLAGGAVACPAENGVCPAGHFLCLDGPAVNGCFQEYGDKKSRACGAFATVPCPSELLRTAPVAPAAKMCPAEGEKYGCPGEGEFRCVTGPAAKQCLKGPPRADPGKCTAFATYPCDDEEDDDDGDSRGVAPEAPEAPTEQTSRLRVTNGCTAEPMWIAHMEGAKAFTDPQSIKLQPQQSYDFHIPDGLESTRYWPKLGCNSHGESCRIGDSGGPGQACDPLHGCAPPVDSKFEATFGTLGTPCDTSKGLIKGCDWLDISLVDGFTVPFKVEVIGHCEGNRGVDCSKLNLATCPEDLQMRHPGHKQLSGCYSPCAKKTYPHWSNTLGVHSPTDLEARMECCPTPPVSPAQCQAGPVAASAYVAMVHQDCPGVYGYAYDDAQGLSVCPAGVRYHVTFYCPGKAAGDLEPGGLSD